MGSGKALAVVSLVSLTSCLGPMYHYSDGVQAHWQHDLRPIPVYLSPDLEPDCEDATRDAIMWWEDKGVSYLELRDGLRSDPAVLGVPRVGEIGVSMGVFSDNDGAVGETSYSLFKNSHRMAHAFVEFRPKYGCTLRTATHEIGHALGLRHDPDPGNVMYFMSMSGPYDVSDEQKEQLK